MGQLENSGFTDNLQIEPVTYHENRTYGAEDYGQVCKYPNISYKACMTHVYLYLFQSHHNSRSEIHQNSLSDHVR